MLLPLFLYADKSVGRDNDHSNRRRFTLRSYFLGITLMSDSCSSFLQINHGCFHSTIYQKQIKFNCQYLLAHPKKHYEQWHEDDDWSTLSSENKAVNSFSIYNKDIIMDAANEMKRTAIIGEEYSKQHNDEGDEFLVDAIDSIYMQPLEPNGPALYDTTKFDDFESHVISQSFLDEAGKEISMLVRCNESPNELLISEGRALPPLTEEETYDFHQLVNINNFKNNDDKDKKSILIDLEPTIFFQNAISEIFYIHARERDTDNDKSSEEMIMDSHSIASWLTTCLHEKVGRFDKRVTKLISQYGEYKSGFLTKENLQSLYLQSVRQELIHPSRGTIPKEKKQQKLSVWNDLIRHDIDPPIVTERKKLQMEMDELTSSSESTFSNTKSSASSVFMDECEIVWGENWDEDENHKESKLSSSNKKNGSDHHYVTNHQNSPVVRKFQQSHKLVKLLASSSDSNIQIPKRMRDGDFVFVDEESCIGCKMCVNIAPSAFAMLDNGRARCFEQTNMPEVMTAVSACPVACIHPISFDELKELETARDFQDETSSTSYNHKIPLHVARRESDTNRKSSWYHSLKHKCYTRKSCPQRGCYDCPMYSSPGENPYFQKKHKESEHQRALEIMESGEGDIWRKFADL